MRTALVLLLILALASIAGSLVPQVGVADARIAQTFRDHPLRARIYDRVGLFDVFGSWWFTLIYVLLFVSLVACLVPRTRAAIRNLRTRPQPTRDLDAMRHFAERRVIEPPEQVTARARRVLRRRLFRVAGAGSSRTLSADKGIAREVGSLLFHWAFLLILVGVVWGRGSGFSGRAVIVEGETWTEAHPNYDGQIREGRFFHEDHSGLRITVDDFEASYRVPSGIPEDFVTRARLADADGRPLGSVEIRVNHPASAEGVKIYQFGYGWAPVIEVTHDGVPIASGPVVCEQGRAPEGIGQLQLPWNCVVRLPTLQPQVAIAFTLWPDIRGLTSLIETGTSMPMLVKFDPLMTFVAYRGDLHADRAVRTNELDTSGLQRWTEGAIGAGETKPLGDGIDVTFADLRSYTVLEVKRDRGLGLLLAAAILVLVGLVPALYTSRRKVWVTAEPDGAGSVVRIGGFALQRRQQFEDEFARLVDEVAGARWRARDPEEVRT